MGMSWGYGPPSGFEFVLFSPIPFMLFAVAFSVIRIVLLLIGIGETLSAIIAFIFLLLLLGAYILAGLIMPIAWVIVKHSNNRFYSIVVRCFKLFYLYYIHVPVLTIILLGVWLIFDSNAYHFFSFDYFITYKFGIFFLVTILPLAILPEYMSDTANEKIRRSLNY